MATHYKFMTAQYLLCYLFPAVSNGQISLISPGAVMFSEFVLVSLPLACVTTADHAIVESSKNTFVLITTKFQVLLSRTCVCKVYVNKHTK